MLVTVKQARVACITQDSKGTSVMDRAKRLAVSFLMQAERRRCVDARRCAKMLLADWSIIGRLWSLEAD